MSARDKTRITIKTYNEVADAYNDQNASIEGIKDSLHFFIEQLTGNIILDVGSGHGRDSHLLAENGFTTVGVDLSSGLTLIAREKSPDTCFILSDMRHLPFRSDVFHGLWVCASFHHLEKKDAPSAIHGFCSILRRSGLLNISVKRGNAEFFEEKNRYGEGPRFYSYSFYSELEKIVLYCGLEVVQSHENIEGPLPRQWVNILARK